MLTKRTGVLIGSLVTALCLVGCGDKGTIVQTETQKPAYLNNSKSYIATEKVDEDLALADLALKEDADLTTDEEDPLTLKE